MLNFKFTQAIETIFNSIKYCHGGEVFVPKLGAYKLGILVEVMKELVGECKIKKIRVRPGEKFHESLISIDEIRHTYDNGVNYIIIDPETHPVSFKKWGSLRKAEIKNEYSSNNALILKKEELVKIIKNEFGL